MWLRRTKSRILSQAVSPPPPPKFVCSSFKDIHILLSDDAARKLFICHRSRSSVKSHLRFLENSAAAEKEEIRIAGSEATVVVYFTSLRVIRSTFEDCKAVRSILSAFRVPIDERDLSMDGSFAAELRGILGLREKSELMLPSVFIGGRYVGGAEEVRRLHETGALSKYVERLPQAELGTCDTCGGYGFVVCVECDGSRKCYREKSGFRSCTLCNENGLFRCPSCSSAKCYPHLTQATRNLKKNDW